MNKFVKIKLTREEALELGLLTCDKCGHPENNHFMDDDKSCARCNCERYEEIPIAGKFIK